MRKESSCKGNALKILEWGGEDAPVKAFVPMHLYKILYIRITITHDTV